MTDTYTPHKFVNSFEKVKAMGKVLKCLKGVAATTL